MMKNTYATLMLLMVIVLLSACGPTISSKDEQAFKTSKAKMEEKLDKTEKENLEKALRVVMLKAMKEKWNKPDDAKYKGKSFDAIVMNMIDGKTFSGIVDFAEDFLQKDRDDNIKKNELEIDSLTQQKAKLIEQNKALDKFKLTKMSISEQEYFDVKSPFLDLTFVNKTGAEIFDYMIEINIYSKKTGELIASQTQGTSDEKKDNYVDGEGIKVNEEYFWSQPLLNEAQNHTTLWKTAKYPITNFKPFDLVIKAFPALIITKKEKLVRAENLEILEKEIKQLQEEVKGLKETKGTLDELELTDK